MIDVSTLPPEQRACKKGDDRTELAETLRAEITVGLCHELRHHLDSRDDPCQDRGASWPCDVAEALRRYAGAEVVER